MFVLGMKEGIRFALWQSPESTVGRFSGSLIIDLMGFAGSPIGHRRTTAPCFHLVGAVDAHCTALPHASVFPSKYPGNASQVLVGRVSPGGGRKLGNSSLNVPFGPCKEQAAVTSSSRSFPPAQGTASNPSQGGKCLALCPAPV